MKKKNMMAVASILLVAMFVGVGTNSVVKSKAEEMVETQMDDINEEKGVKDFIKKFRKDNVSVTITTIDDLHDEFDNYENIDENIRENVLAKASDEVIMQFLSEEQKAFYSINQNVENIGVFSEELEENIEENNLNYIKSVDTDYYIKGKDSYKKVTTLTSKYEGKCQIICIDEAENNYRGVGEYTKLGEPKDEVIFKEYGKRKFSYKVNFVFSDIDVAFGYTLDYGRIEARYIKGEIRNSVSPALKIVVVNEVITNSVAENLNEKITAEAEYQGTHGAAFWGGYDTAKWKVKMSVEKLADSNHPTKCGMNVRQYAQWYEQWF